MISYYFQVLCRFRCNDNLYLCDQLLFPGAVPFPLLFGLMFDQVCLVWQQTCNDEQGSCWIYDNQSLGKRLMYMIIAVKILSTSSFLGAFLVYKPPINNDKGDSNSDSEVLPLTTVTTLNELDALDPYFATEMISISSDNIHCAGDSQSWESLLNDTDYELILK